jgi:hypothetical protein
MPLSDDGHAISVMVGRLAPKGPGAEEELEGEIDEGLIVAARDVLVALGQDGGARDSDSAAQAFEDKARHLAGALFHFFEIADSRPHAEGPHMAPEAGEEEELNSYE